MPLSWNEIKTRAAAFVNEWKADATHEREEAEAQTFENEFFNVFGVNQPQPFVRIAPAGPYFELSYNLFILYKYLVFKEGRVINR
jgi:hypothetical protein